MNEKLCVVMPVYNEQEAIGSVLEKWAKALDAMGVDYVIRPYNDGSKDSSLAVMKSVAGYLPRVEVRDKPNGGHGNTILTGYRDAAADGFDWVFQIDSDDEMGPEKFGELWTKRTNYDFLIGIRDGRVQQLPRKVISFVSRLCVRLFYGKSVWDVNTPYRLMRVSAFKDFFTAIPLTTFAPNVILSGLAARHKLRCYEIRVPQRDRQTGEVSIKKWKLLKAAVKSFGQTILFSVRVRSSRICWWLAAAILLSTVLKIWFASWEGPTGDTKSFALVADRMMNGQSVYTCGRYNYAPVWAGIVTVVRFILGDGLHTGIVGLIAIFDAFIACVLFRRKLCAAAFLFILAPLGVFISGFFRMFDNFAIAIALLAIVLFGEEREGEVGVRRTLFLAVLIGCSLMIKHVFAFFPLWLFFHEKGLRRRLLVLLLPMVIFFGSFTLPIGYELCTRGFVLGHSDSAFAGIIKNVFQYEPGGHSYFWDYIVPLSRFGLAPKMCFFCVMAGLSVCGLWLTAWDLVLAYLLAVFAFSPGQCSYYWAIPLVAIACSQLRWFVAFNIVGLIAMWYRSGLLCHLGRVVPTCPHFIGSVSQVLSVGIAVIVLVLHVTKSVRHKRM